MAGPLARNTSIWDEVTGGSGGLIPNTVYYLSETTRGHMTTIQPTNGNGQIVQIGVALDARTLNIGIVPLNAVPTVPTTEHLSGAGGTPGPATIPIANVATSFLENTFTESTLTFGPLADGSVDGQIHNFVNVSANGMALVRVQITSFEGGLTFMTSTATRANFSVIWNSLASEWQKLGTPLAFTES
jgi:hypothetical protein